MFTNPQKNIEFAYIGEGMKVADFGAAVGHHAIMAARQVGVAGVVYAIDVQSELLAKLAREARGEKLENVHIILGNIEKPGGSTLKEGSVDRVLLINTLFQLENKAAALEEAKRTLNKGGRLAIIDWQESFGQIGPHADHIVKEKEAIKLAESAGFKLQSQFEAGLHHYGLLFRL